MAYTKEATFGQLVDAVRTADPERSTEDLALELWPLFKAAVASALEELADQHAEGVGYWQNLRHTRSE